MAPQNRFQDLHEVLQRIRHLSMKPADVPKSEVRNSYRRCLISEQQFHQ